MTGEAYEGEAEAEAVAHVATSYPSVRKSFLLYLKGTIHRTVQQRVMVLFIQFIRELAEAEPNIYFDGRNQASHELAKRLLPVIDDYTKGTFDLPHV